MTQRDEVMIAFSKVPYPGDEALTPCGCDECRWEVGRLRGKKWTRLGLDDFGAGDGEANVALLTPAAFHYFLPGLMLVALDHSEARGDILGKVIHRITASDREGKAARAKVDQVINRLSGRQRQVLADLIRQAEGSEPHVPAIWQSAIANLIDGIATPYDHGTVERWLAEEDGGRSGLPPASGDRGP
jgi:hypothetical protein